MSETHAAVKRKLHPWKRSLWRSRNDVYGDFALSVDDGEDLVRAIIERKELLTVAQLFEASGGYEPTMYARPYKRNCRKLPERQDARPQAAPTADVRFGIRAQLRPPASFLDVYADDLAADAKDLDDEFWRYP